MRQAHGLCSPQSASAKEDLRYLGDRAAIPETAAHSRPTGIHPSYDLLQIHQDEALRIAFDSDSCWNGQKRGQDDSPRLRYPE